MRDKQNLEDSEVHMKIELYISWNISKQKQIIIQTISLIYLKEKNKVELTTLYKLFSFFWENFVEVI